MTPKMVRYFVRERNRIKEIKRALASLSDASEVIEPTTQTDSKNTGLTAEIGVQPATPTHNPNRPPAISERDVSEHPIMIEARAFVHACLDRFGQVCTPDEVERATRRVFESLPLSVRNAGRVRAEPDVVTLRDGSTAVIIDAGATIYHDDGDPRAEVRDSETGEVIFPAVKGPLWIVGGQDDDG